MRRDECCSIEAEQHCPDVRVKSSCGLGGPIPHYRRVEGRKLLIDIEKLAEGSGVKFDGLRVEVKILERGRNSSESVE